MNQKQIEKRALIVTTIANTIIAAAGFYVFFRTRLQAMFVDCFYTSIGLVSAIAALAISRISRKRTKHHPGGMWFLEPLYAVLKMLLILFLLLYAVYNTAEPTYRYFAFGEGEPLNAAPVVPYGVLMFAPCFAVGLYNRSQNKKIGNISTMLGAETRANFLDGLQSLGCGIAAGLLFFIEKQGSPLSFLHYTGDFFITLLLSVISIKEPIRVLVQSFREITGGVCTDKGVNAYVREVLDTGMAYTGFHVYKVGMFLKVVIAVSDGKGIAEKRAEIENRLKRRFENVAVVLELG